MTAKKKNPSKAVKKALSRFSAASKLRAQLVEMEKRCANLECEKNALTHRVGVTERSFMELEINYKKAFDVVKKCRATLDFYGNRANYAKLVRIVEVRSVPTELIFSHVSMDDGEQARVLVAECKKLLGLPCE